MLKLLKIKKSTVENQSYFIDLGKDTIFIISFDAFEQSSNL